MGRGKGGFIWTSIDKESDVGFIERWILTLEQVLRELTDKKERLLGEREIEQERLKVERCLEPQNLELDQWLSLESGKLLLGPSESLKDAESSGVKILLPGKLS